MNERVSGKVMKFIPAEENKTGLGFDGFGFIALDVDNDSDIPDGKKGVYFGGHELSSGMRLGQARRIANVRLEREPLSVTFELVKYPDGNRQAKFIRPEFA